MKNLKQRRHNYYVQRFSSYLLRHHRERERKESRMLLRYSARGRCGVVENDLNSPSKKCYYYYYTTTSSTHYFTLYHRQPPQWQTKGGTRRRSFKNGCRNQNRHEAPIDFNRYDPFLSIVKIKATNRVVIISPNYRFNRPLHHSIYLLFLSTFNLLRFVFHQFVEVSPAICLSHLRHLKN